MTTTTIDGTGWNALLADGAVVHIRPVRDGDRSELADLHRISSARSLYLRYFTAGRRSGEQYLDKLLAEEHPLALIAEVRGAAVGMASCEPVPGTADADVAFLVADSFQRRGVGTLLLEYLAALARRRGVRRFVAETLTSTASPATIRAQPPRSPVWSASAAAPSRGW